MLLWILFQSNLSQSNKSTAATSEADIKKGKKKDNEKPYTCFLTLCDICCYYFHRDCKLIQYLFFLFIVFFSIVLQDIIVHWKKVTLMVECGLTAVWFVSCWSFRWKSGRLLHPLRRNEPKPDCNACGERTFFLFLLTVESSSIRLR